MLGGAVARADVDPPVCVACGCCPRGLGRATPTYHPFRFPIGLDHYRKLPCAPPRELGVDNAWLPVTHLGGPHKGPTDSGGLWFYYARGCSDFLWDVGRTLLARNRAHLAVVQASALQQAEEIEAVLAEMAELRAENVRLAEGAIVKKAKGGGGPKLAEALADPPEEEGHAEVD